MRAWLWLLALAAPAAGAPSEAEAPAPVVVRRASGPITVDGDLSDPGWRGSAVIDTFYETDPGDNLPPKVRTTALLTYDGKYFYVGIRCDDPEPARIRAPYVERDALTANEDYVAVFLDARNDHRTALEFRTSPRGVQTDGVFNDATQAGDSSPDFFYDTVARITSSGWEAELRIPFTSLRYSKTDPQTWGILILRMYPREFRYFIQSSRVPRGSNCWICHEAPITGLTGLPSARGLTVAPYTSVQDTASAPETGAPLSDRTTEADAGLDVKWTPDARTAVDATLRPDFSQVEADVAQIAANSRFALFFPEKRPFFLEGVDLLATPIQAVYTRTITSPLWGARATGKLGASSYTILLAQDRGGGSVVLPGPTGSDLADQDFRSTVGIARWRRDLGASFVGLLLTDRESDGGGHNRVAGPDFQWRPNEKDQVTGQVLVSETRTPNRPELAEEWDGRRLASGAWQLSWYHTTRGIDWYTWYNDYGRAFRADEGFVPQVGFREGIAEVGYNAYPRGLLRHLRPFLALEYAAESGGRLLSRGVRPGLSFQGRWGLSLFGYFAPAESNRAAGRVFETTYGFFSLSASPSRKVPSLGLSGRLGQTIDFANVRPGHGGELSARASLRPTDHLTLEARSVHRWLDVTAEDGRSGRLFTAQVQRLRAVYNFSARAFLRLIAQYVSTTRDPALYVDEVSRRTGSLRASALVSYRINWQTALFLGYGDARELTETDDLVRSDRQVFLKLSYAFQR